MLGRLATFRSRATAGATAAVVAASTAAAYSGLSPPALAQNALWAPDDWFALQAKPPPALSPWEWRPLKVWSVEQTSPNTKLIRFVFDNIHAAAGMEVASYLLVRAPIGKEKEDGTRGVVIRPYTPSHTTVGYLELVIKRYEEGNMSRHIHSLKPGDTLDFKGPVMGLPIIQNEFESIGLIAGGTGITPMLQVAQRIVENEGDATKVSLIFANVSEDDILLKQKIDELAAAHPRQLAVYYVLDQPPEGWQGGTGYLTKEMLAERLPPPSEGLLSKVLVCGPPGMVKSVAGGLPNKKGQGEFGGILKELGYEASQVFKF